MSTRRSATLSSRPLCAGAAKYYRRPKNRPPRRTLRRNKFAGGEHIPGENPPGEKIMPPSLKQKPPPVTTEQLQLLAGGGYASWHRQRPRRSSPVSLSSLRGSPGAWTRTCTVQDLDPTTGPPITRTVALFIQLKTHLFQNYRQCRLQPWMSIGAVVTGL